MKTIILKIAAIAITLFALITLFMSGSVIFDLFGIRVQEGNYVLFVVVLNFICGFLYLTSAYGLFTQKRWTTSFLITSTVVLILSFIGLLIHINSGGAYEVSTIKALLFRISLTAIFTGISWFGISKTSTNEINENKTF
ncbi:MAG: hypothetical protein IT281_04775 [Ignavibacteria bacterium]|nr:hypothetical protein [Ignavibacteria bacterium]MCC7158832.1 hypothetical protein [Ignavibacteria bacterium]